MKLYAMRHGQTDWNDLHRVQGQTDVPLNAEGLRQAEEAARKLARVRIARIYTSELVRARQTAQIVADRQQGFCPCMPVGCLNEQNFGRFEGISTSDKDLLQMKSKLCRRFEGGGESYFEVAARVYPFLRWLKTQPEDSVLLVTHNGILRVIASYFLNLENDEFVAYGMDNCEVRTFEL